MASSDSSDQEEGLSITTRTNVKRKIINDSPQKDLSPRHYKQTYRKEWESMHDFKGWLSNVPGEPTRAYCKFCEKTLHAHRLSLLKHTCTLKHTRAAKNDYTKQSLAQTKQTSQAVKPVGGKEHVSPLKLKEEYGANTTDVSHSTSMDANTQDSDADVPMDSQPNCNTLDSNIATAAPTTSTPSQSVDKVIITEVPPSTIPAEPEDDSYISTHILDTSKGKPLAGLLVSLYRLVDGRWTHLSESMSNPDGRCTDFVKKKNFVAGRYKLHYDVDRYYECRRIDSLYPFIEIVFDVRSPQEHYHIPLLLSPFGYTTYKGS